MISSDAIGRFFLSNSQLFVYDINFRDRLEGSVCDDTLGASRRGKKFLVPFRDKKGKARIVVGRGERRGTLLLRGTIVNRTKYFK